MVVIWHIVQGPGKLVWLVQNMNYLWKWEKLLQGIAHGNQNYSKCVQGEHTNHSYCQQWQEHSRQFPQHFLSLFISFFQQLSNLLLFPVFSLSFCLSFSLLLSHLLFCLLERGRWRQTSSNGWTWSKPWRNTEQVFACNCLSLQKNVGKVMRPWTTHFQVTSSTSHYNNYESSFKFVPLGLTPSSSWHTWH